jgi:hypothetical protein
VLDYKRFKSKITNQFSCLSEHVISDLKHVAKAYLSLIKKERTNSEFKSYTYKTEYHKPIIETYTFTDFDGTEKVDIQKILYLEHNRKVTSTPNSRFYAELLETCYYVSLNSKCESSNISSKSSELSEIKEQLQAYEMETLNRLKSSDSVFIETVYHDAVKNKNKALSELIKKVHYKGFVPSQSSESIRLESNKIFESKSYVKQALFYFKLSALAGEKTNDKIKEIATFSDSTYSYKRTEIAANSLISTYENRRKRKTLNAKQRTDAKNIIKLREHLLEYRKSANIDDIKTAHKIKVVRSYLQNKHLSKGKASMYFDIIWKV